ncbi:hypothetical protein HMPREF1544_05533 [Mucor circinelloides 1006PhL]|uniref:Arrestin C-terminal-like domain-containing protein n=1 Tax=Mucor circinelloides f. circinelloides (strain 1006PhL) TaxID=1220926 RepID=S2K609_MUCC1|nr:hypothetical protein HMPREF1544_05533 [Mucor circinelloides 1006PhL]
MSTSKELAIVLRNPDKSYYPGDVIHGQIRIDSKKSIDIQHMSVNFAGCIDGCGDKTTLINNTQLLATPTAGRKYTTLSPGKCHTFDFEFKIPTDDRLPSFANIPKVAKITYLITATHKKPMFKLSHTLSTATQEIKVLDMINVLLPDYRMPVKMNKDLGFINGSKLSQWCLNLPRSAFYRGQQIKLECQIHHFPAMQKSKAIKITLSRQVHKTSSAKVVENKVLSTTAIDLDTKDSSPSQTFPVELQIPLDTPPSIFPDTGRTLSVSYLIQAELKMKGSLAPFQLKIQQLPMAANPSHISLHTLASSPSSPLPAHRKSTTNLLPDTRRSSGVLQVHSPPPHQVSFSEFDNIKPLPRLEEITQKRTYSSHRSSSSSSLLAPISPSSPPPLTSSASQSTTPSASVLTSSYQQEFDDYIPTTPLRRLSFSSARSSTSTAANSIDRSLTPLPSMKQTQINPYNTVSYLNRKSAPRPSLLSINPQTPHEIGPNDVITRQGKSVEKPHSDYFDVKTLETSGDDDENGSTPGLLSRHDTISTASSGGLCDPFQAITSSPLPGTTKTTILLSPIGRSN